MFTLGRGIDIHYSTNRLILIISAVSGVLAGLLFGDFLTGIKVAGTIFLSWAFGRETDPKREYGAFVGVAIALLYSLTTDAFMVQFLEILFMMLLFRMINQTAGEKPSLVDAGVTVSLAVFLYYSASNPIYLLIYLIGLFASQAFKEDQLFHIILAAGAGFSGGYILYSLGEQASFSSPILSPMTLILLAVLYVLTSYLDRKKRIYDDEDRLMDNSQILIAQAFFALSVLLLSFLSTPLFGNMVIYVSAMAGSIIYRPINRLGHFEK